MKHANYADIPAEKVEQGAEGVTIRWLITERDGAENFLMRHFEIAPDGHTPRHRHAWEHEVFILAGRGFVLCDAGEEPIRPGDVVFMPSGEIHQFRNSGKEPLQMLCLIPKVEKR